MKNISYQGKQHQCFLHVSIMPGLEEALSLQQGEILLQVVAECLIFTSVGVKEPHWISMMLFWHESRSILTCFLQYT